MDDDALRSRAADAGDAATVGRAAGRSGTVRDGVLRGTGDCGEGEAAAGGRRLLGDYILEERGVLSLMSHAHSSGCEGERPHGTRGECESSSSRRFEETGGVSRGGGEGTLAWKRPS